jgi:hypothetical protein
MAGTIQLAASSLYILTRLVTALYVIRARAMPAGEIKVRLADELARPAYNERYYLLKLKRVSPDMFIAAFGVAVGNGGAVAYIATIFGIGLAFEVDATFIIASA